MDVTKKSWHYWVADWGNFRPRVEWDGNTPVYSTDICTYSRAVAKGVIILTLLTALASIFVIPIVTAIIFWVLYCFGAAVLPLSQLVQIGMIMGSVLLVFISLGAVFEGIKLLVYASTESKPKPKEPGFIKLAYQSWKDKYCVKVDIKD